MPAFRFLTALIILFAGCLTIKVANLAEAFHGMIAALQVIEIQMTPMSHAQEEKKEAKEEEPSTPQEGTEAPKSSEEAKASEETKPAISKEAEASLAEANIKILKQKPEEASLLTNSFSEVELDLLKQLTKRREELEQWSNELVNKENILKATESRIDSKIEQLKSLQSELQNLLVQYDRKQDEEIASLVKIYENMKPKDAARIFEEIEIPTLLQVIRRMKEAKVAPILAQMNPEKAKEVTVTRAKRQYLEPTKEPVVSTTP